MKSIKEEWFNFSWFNQAKRHSPNDGLIYEFSRDSIQAINNVLDQYRFINPSNEGIVYLAGQQHSQTIKVLAVIAPETVSSEGRVTISSESNFHVVKTLSSHKLIHLGQVHSHPGSWVDHSRGDDQWASFKRTGLLSIVVPSYGTDGLLPFHKCGVHRFEDNQFIRLSKKYILKHFVVEQSESLFIDLRDKNDERWKLQNGIS
jgi:hypothetical protein